MANEQCLCSSKAAVFLRSMSYHLSPLGLISFLNFVCAFFLATISFLKSNRNSIRISYGLFAYSIAFYAFFYFLWQSTDIQAQAIFFFKLCIVGVVLINNFLVQFIHDLLGFSQKYQRRLYFTYALNAIFCICALGWFYESWRLKYNYGLWPVPSIVFHFYLVWWFFQVEYCFFYLWSCSVCRNVGRLKQQCKWVLGASIIGYVGGASNWLVWYGINFPPYLNGGISIYAACLAYAIFRHKLFDIEVIIKRTLIFAGLFGLLILVVGFIAAITQSYVGQLIGFNQATSNILSVLVTMLLFDRMQKLLANLTDKFLFQKKYDYQKLLKDASRGMSNIESLEHLLGLVVHFITMKMRVKNAAVMMREGKSDQYQLIYQRGFDKKFLTLTLYQNDPLIHYLESHKEAVDIERIKEQVEASSYRRDKSEKAYDYEAIRERMNQLQASCCVPSFLGRELRNILMLGEKKSGEYYSNEDLNLLYTLA